VEVQSKILSAVLRPLANPGGYAPQKTFDEKHILGQTGQLLTCAKSFQLRPLTPMALSLDPTGGFAPNFRYRFALRAQYVAPDSDLWPPLDPSLVITCYEVIQ